MSKNRKIARLKALETTEKLQAGSTTTQELASKQWIR